MPKRIKLQQIGLSNGWEKLPGTFTYASATTINTSENLTGYIQKGDKIKIDNTSTKYFVVVTLTASLITVTGGSDFTVAALAISNVFFSKVESPQGFPNQFNLTVANFTTEGTPFTNQPTLSLLYMQVIGKRCFLRGLFLTHATSGGTGKFFVNVNTGQMMPISGDDAIGVCCNISSNANTGFAFVLSGAQNRVSLQKYDNTAIAGNGAYVGFDISYVI